MIGKCSGLGIGAALVLGVVCLNCGSAGSDSASGNVGAPGPTSPNLGNDGSVNTNGGSGASAPPGGSLPNAGTTSSAGSGGAPIIVVPPEKELEQSFLAPVVTGKFVFSANPKSGRVAVIDAATYAVRLFNAGFGPKYLAAIPGDRGAIVINELSHDTTLFEVSGEEVTVADVSLPIHDDANAWSTSPDGRFAIAWTRTESDQKLDPTAGSQTITVLDLSRRTSKSSRSAFTRRRSSSTKPASALSSSTTTASASSRWATRRRCRCWRTCPRIRWKTRPRATSASCPTARWRSCASRTAPSCASSI
jgi:hypothetical protein